MKKRNTFAIVLLGIICVAVYVAINTDRWKYGRFNRDKWASLVTHDQQKRRYYMAKDLVSSRCLIGKKYDEIVTILGKPDRNTTQVYLLYYLGPERGSLFKIDSDWLEIQFDKENAVVTTLIRPD